MPGRDGTGPMRKGEMTGRGLGNCVVIVNESEELTGLKNRSGGFRRRMGTGAGRQSGRCGFGFRFRFRSFSVSEDCSVASVSADTQTLRKQIEDLSLQVNEISDKLKFTEKL